MAYFIRTARTGRFAHGTLVEMTAKEAREAAFDERWVYDAVPATTAHRWVRQGGHHETPLWLDGSRVRYARDSR